jgi:hypothetical protein
MAFSFDCWCNRVDYRMTINSTDIIILIVVVIILGLIVYFSLIRNRDKGPCRNCAQFNGKKASRLVRDYKKKNKTKR